MTKLISLVTWTQRYLLYLVLPAIIIMRIISWSKLQVTSLYLYYQETLGSCPDVDINVAKLPMLGKIIYFLAESIPTILILTALWYFYRMLLSYKQHVLFSPETNRLFKHINVCIFMWTIYQCLWATISSLIVSLWMPAGQRCVIVKFDFDDLVHILGILILSMMLYIAQEAYRLKSEQDLVV